MNKPVSIAACIPCFNARSTLAEAIASVRNQSHPTSEVLVVDDGSSDGSGEIARAAGVRVVKHPTNLGRGAARATAVREARGDLILFCDAGIELPPRFLELALERMGDRTVAGVFGRVNGHGSTLAHRWRSRHLFKTDGAIEFCTTALLATGGALLRRSAILEAGNFRGDLRAGEDADLGRRLLEKNFQVILDPSLELRALASEGICSVLRRYARWNAPTDARASWRDYIRIVSYSIRVMARDDLRNGDFPCVMLSLICPHVLFWTGRRVSHSTLTPPVGKPA